MRLTSLLLVPTYCDASLLLAVTCYFNSHAYILAVLICAALQCWEGVINNSGLSRPSAHWELSDVRADDEARQVLKMVSTP